MTKAILISPLIRKPLYKPGQCLEEDTIPYVLVDAQLGHTSTLYL